MFFCAGKGTRMKALTQQVPKPMVRVNSVPLVDYALEAMSGVNRRFANTHYLPDILESHLRAANVEPIHEPELLETGGGLKHALPTISRDVLFTMNTDAVWKGPKPAELLVKQWDPTRMDGLMLLIPIDRAIGHKGQGDFLRDKTGLLHRGAGEVFTGLQIIKSKFVERVAETHFSMNVVWDDLLQRKTLFGAIYPGTWCDVGYPEAIELAETLLKDD